jgi:hypothetical protein
MTENTMSTNRGDQTEPTDSERAVQQALQDQADLSDLQMQMSQADASSKHTARGRKPLFRN